MHSHPLRSRRRRGSIGLAALTAAALLTLVGGASTAIAAVLDDVISDVAVSPTTPGMGTMVRTDIDWCVPDGTMAGDTFSLTLSEYLRELPASFDLTDPADSTQVVATAVISDTDPAIVTFTMTEYAETHRDVCGSAFIQSFFDNGLTPGETVPFVSIANDGTEFTTLVTPQGGGTPTDDLDEAFKFGGLSDDQGHTDPVGVAGWFVVSPVGPLDRVVISDTPGGGMLIDCDSVDVIQGTRTATNIAAPITQPTVIVPVTCTEDTVSVMVGPIPDGQAVRLFFRVDLAEPTGPGSHTFSNTANVISTSGDGSVRTDTPSRSLTSSTGGGGGEGDDEPSIDIEKWATTLGATAGDADVAPGIEVAAGLPTAVTFTVTNDGEEALTDVRIGDSTIAGLDLTELSCDFGPLGGPSAGTVWDGPFEVGSAFECTGQVPALAPGAIHVNTADVTGIGVESGREVEDEDPLHLTAPSTEPLIGIVKGDDDGNPADTAEDAVSLPDGTAGLVFTVSNEGDEPLVDVTVVDRVITGGTVDGLACRFPDGSIGTEWTGPLEPGETFDCSATLTGVAPGSEHHDIARVSATGLVSGTAVDDEDAYFAKRAPATALAVTGADAAVVSSLAFALLLLGAAVVVVGRRIRD